jgi:hypothetical protein
VTVRDDGENGVMVASGGRFGGYSLWITTFSHNLVNVDR